MEGMATAGRRNISIVQAVGETAHRPLLEFRRPSGISIRKEIMLGASGRRHNVANRGRQNMAIIGRRTSGGRQAISSIGASLTTGMNLLEVKSYIMMSRVIDSIIQRARQHGRQSTCRQSRGWHQ